MVGTRAYTTALSLIVHPRSRKQNPLMGHLAQCGVSQACSFQKELQTRPTLAHRLTGELQNQGVHPRSNSRPWVSETLVYTEENLVPTLSREAAGHTQLCHWAMAKEAWLLRGSSAIPSPQKMLQASPPSWPRPLGWGKGQRPGHRVSGHK